MSVCTRRSSLSYLRTARVHHERKPSRLRDDGEGHVVPVLKDFIKALPYELSAYILQLAIALSKRSSKRLIELSSICSAWRTFIVSSPIFWSHFEFSGETALKSLDVWESRAEGDRPSTHKIDARGLISVSVDCWSGSDVDSFYRTFDNWAGLQELTISLHWNTPFLTPRVLSLLHLKRLEIRCLSETNPAHTHMTLEGMDTSRLHVLKLHHPKNLSLFLLSSQTWPALRMLEITGSFHQEKQLTALESFFAQNPNLEHLALLNDQSVALGFGESASNIASRNHHPPITGPANIRSLSIRMPYGVSESWLQMFVPSSLESLEVNVLHLSVLANFFSSPSIWRAQDPVKITTPIEIARKPKLVDLRVSMPGFSESELVRLSGALPDLETMEIRSGWRSGMNFNLRPQTPCVEIVRKHLADRPREFVKLKRLTFDDGEEVDVSGDWRKRKEEKV